MFDLVKSSLVFWKVLFTWADITKVSTFHLAMLKQRTVDATTDLIRAVSKTIQDSDFLLDT